ncbi:NAD(P)H-dependent flavin oxidoreductase [Sphingomonas quercus]|uniref:Propionate 3-nitronate monooxygenase n=1 Tax=Sphingomonas quercus TaxID=2842451 RepID=A0ABS6BEZ8_9SPHN|nr:nitronate monooxygenase [Sphingomonas quercus]MBU3076883.1 nitronate monooxygenase [Sphingomonas quercus]
MSGWRDRRLAERLGLSTPIVQAPMAGAGGVDLAIGAATGGALASLPAALIAPEAIIQQISTFRAATGAAVNLNFFCHQLEPAEDAAWRDALAPFYAAYGVGYPAVPPPARAPFGPRQAEAVEQVFPEVVSFHFGLPDDTLLARVKATGALIVGNATTPAEARWLAARGVDAIIAQGHEAGGHAGRFLGADPAEHMGTIALVPQVADATGLPVIAAGGIGDERGVAAALVLGAALVQLGTAYLFCPESLIAQGHRDLLAGEAAEHSRVTNLFTGGIARRLPSPLFDNFGAVSPLAPAFPHAAAALAELRKAAEAAGDGRFSPWWSGEAARLGQALPAEALTRRLADGALALLGDAR